MTQGRTVSITGGTEKIEEHWFVCTDGWDFSCVRGDAGSSSRHLSI